MTFKRWLHVTASACWFGTCLGICGCQDSDSFSWKSILSTKADRNVPESVASSAEAQSDATAERESPRENIPGNANSGSVNVTTDHSTFPAQASSQDRPVSGGSGTQQHNHFPDDSPSATEIPVSSASSTDHAPGSRVSSNIPAGTSATKLSIRLFTAVALAQTLPTGTAMGFSAEYQVSGGSLNSAAQYAWRIQRSDGEQMAFLIPQLKSSGQLQTFVSGWRPRQGPFTSQIVEVAADGSQHPVSRSVSHR